MKKIHPKSRIYSGRGCLCIFCSRLIVLEQARHASARTAITILYLVPPFLMDSNDNYTPVNIIQAMTRSFQSTRVLTPLLP